jgi:antitoxin VapB
MNIKDPEAHRLAREVAEATGESLTRAVTESLRERLERLRGEQGGRLSERLLAIGRDTAKRLPESVRSMDHGDLLYGKDGLPR